MQMQKTGMEQDGEESEAAESESEEIEVGTSKQNLKPQKNKKRSNKKKLLLNSKNFPSGANRLEAMKGATIGAIGVEPKEDGQEQGQRDEEYVEVWSEEWNCWICGLKRTVDGDEAEQEGPPQKKQRPGGKDKGNKTKGNKYGDGGSERDRDRSRRRW